MPTKELILNTSASWPPHCCVAAFVVAAIHSILDLSLDRALVARAIGTRVGPEDRNPFGLQVTLDPELLGVTRPAAEGRLPSLLKEFDSRLTFQHTPFNTVTLGLFDEVLRSLTSKAVVVGVGLRWDCLIGQAHQSRHVCRAQPAEGPEEVILLDDSSGIPPHPYRFRWETVEHAVRHLGDGFWLIGWEEVLKNPGRLS